MTSNPYESPQGASDAPKPKKKNGFTLIELLVVIGIIVVLIVLFFPATRGGAPQAARRMICSNNLKQIGLALHNYNDAYGAFPPAYTVDPAGKPLHSWRTLILPFVEQGPLYDKIDLSKPWNDPANSDAYTTELDVFRCPSADLPPNYTAYLAVVSPGSFFRSTESRLLTEEITDGASKTVMIIEATSDHAVHWMAPQDADEQIFLDFGSDDKLPHESGKHVVFVDPSVQFISSTTDPAYLRAMITIDGNDHRLEEPSETAPQ